ncbi:MAG: class II D-tagatose-bisphosphate aldolase, non-catalytic subunit, partial [Calditrichia bacterium]
ETAMQKARDLVCAYVAAGYQKIHLDASFRCADDPEVLPDETIAERAADLCYAAESCYQKRKEGERPVYVIGTDVPPPGGAKESAEAIHVTSPAAVRETIALSERAFARRDLQQAWRQVIAVVVQPGVEFGDQQVFPYKKEKAAALAAFIEKDPQLVFEAHSTDYQLPAALRQMVVDHFAILKVGPWLTFAFREAVFALSQIEKELYSHKSSNHQSNLMEVVERVMVDNPVHWKKHYHGSENEKALARKFSLSDRIRYYWPNPDIDAALNSLLYNLSHQEIPLALISQYLPNQYEKARLNPDRISPQTLILNKIQEVLKIYYRAAQVQKMFRV